MGKVKDPWAKVIRYLRNSKRDPDKTLKLLKGGDKGTESNYTINRSSYSMNCIAVITQKRMDPKNKGLPLTQVIRNWVKTKDFKDFYNLLRSTEKLKYDISLVEKYVKQIKDLWDKPNQKHWRQYFADTKGYLIMGTKSGIGTKKKVKNSLYGANEKIIKEAIPKIKKRLKYKT